MLPGFRNAVVSQRNVIYNGLTGSDARILTTGGDQVSHDLLCAKLDRPDPGGFIVASEHPTLRSVLLPWWV